MSESTQSTQLKGQFVIERPCKHSIRFKAYDEVAETIAKTIYFNRDGFNDLSQPKKVEVTVKPIGD